ncbi:HNH endonuclease signature motif containing protein [Actinophytocola sediminis]
MFTPVFEVPPGDAAQAVPLAKAFGMQRVAWQAEGHALEHLAVFAANADERFAALEVAALLGMSFRAAQRRLDLAVTLVTRLPLTLEAVKQGRFDSYRAGRVAEAVAVLSDQDAAIVEAEVVPQVEDLAPASLNRLLGRVIRRIDAAAILRRHEQRVAARRVDAYPTEDGCAAFTVHGPADRVHLADERVNAIARRLKETGAAGDRTLDQLRADVALDLLAGKDFEHAKVTVQLTLSAATALGVSTAPAQLAGYGDLPARRALVLAGQTDATWRRILTDPKTGQAIDVGRRRYTPPAALRDQVRAELPTCTAPGCVRPAYQCDLDHRQPFPDGPTDRDNLHPACRRHHQGKTHGGWQVHDQTDTLVWVSPAGYRYPHWPEPIADPDPPPY